MQVLFATKTYVIEVDGTVWLTVWLRWMALFGCLLLFGCLKCFWSFGKKAGNYARCRQGIQHENLVPRETTPASQFNVLELTHQGLIRINSQHRPPMALALPESACPAQAPIN